MIQGTVTDEGDPTIEVELAGRTWLAVIDTGFNGDLELPEQLLSSPPVRFLFRWPWSLAGGQKIDQDLYEMEFEFDGQTQLVEATFAPGNEILIGTHLLRRHRLEVDFPESNVLLERKS